MNKFTRLSLLSCALALAASFATPAFAAEGACLQWDVSGLWIITQSNGTTVRMNLQQTATRIQGVAEYSYYNNDLHKAQTIGGPVDGYLEHGSFLRVTAYWSNSTAGDYTGQVELDGGMNGFAVEKNDPGNKATFHATGYPRCLSREAAVPASPTVPPVALGRVHTTVPPVALGRVHTTGPNPPICDAARSARERNSPAAPGLERQCAALMAQLPPPVTPPPVIPPPVTPPTTDTPPLPVLDQAWRDEKAARGEELVNQDPMALEVRNQWQDAGKVRAFDIGMAVAEGDTAPGPGKRAIHDALSDQEQRPFDVAVAYSIDRTANAELAAIGARIAETDPAVAEARASNRDPLYWLGFDIATGLFGDPALGAAGSTTMGTGSLKIRNALVSEWTQKGFDDAVAFHQHRSYHN